MRMADVRGFVLDRLQVAGECDGFDGGNARLCHARLAVLPLFSPGEIRADFLTESLLNQSYTFFTPSSSNNVPTHSSIKSAYELVSFLILYVQGTVKVSSRYMFVKCQSRATFHEEATSVGAIIAADRRCCP
jgi:hypothetical protein